MILVKPLIEYGIKAIYTNFKAMIYLVRFSNGLQITYKIETKSSTT